MLPYTLILHEKDPDGIYPTMNMETIMEILGFEPSPEIIYHGPDRDELHYAIREAQEMGYTIVYTRLDKSLEKKLYTMTKNWGIPLYKVIVELLPEPHPKAEFILRPGTAVRVTGLKRIV